MQLKVFDICREGVHVLGPGNRYVIWVQGCMQKCAGCITPESRPLSGGILIDTKDIAADIILSKNIDGITISGGEPFLQPLPLCELLAEVRSCRPELTIIIYTGYRYGSLVNDPQSKGLISHADLIIDGPYIESMNDNKGIRGSSNQHLHPVTSRLDEYLDLMDNCDRRQVKVMNADGTFSRIGVPPVN